MKSPIFRILLLLLCVALVCPVFLPANVQAVCYYRQPPERTENDPNDPAAAQNITDKSLITRHSGFKSIGYLFNGREYGTECAAENASLTLECGEGIGYLYLIFSSKYGPYTVTNNDTGTTVTAGQHGFLHDLVDLSALFGTAPTSVTVDFISGPARLSELKAFSCGYLPDYVQVWEPAKDNETDLILFSTHGDDDQLFFAGLLPYYTALDYEVLVVYMADHSLRQGFRLHEMLNGLWNCGVTTYPVLGAFNDFYEENLNKAYQIFQRSGVTRDDIIEYITIQLRKYKPMVVVGHDFDGEYSHAQHMIFADCLAEAIEVSQDAARFPESAEIYGIWEVPKAYFHLYKENPIVMDWDTPMEALDGYTPFEITQLFGYPQHVSQRESWVSNWINGIRFSVTKASQITKYSPCEYGLYRSTVGLDTAKNDMFENVCSHAEQKRLAEEARLAEEERLAEATRLAEEAKRAEQARAAEAARLAEEARLAEAARIAEEATSRNQRIAVAVAAAAALLALAAAVSMIRKRNR